MNCLHPQKARRNSDDWEDGSITPSFILNIINRIRQDVKILQSYHQPCQKTMRISVIYAFFEASSHEL